VACAPKSSDTERLERTSGLTRFQGEGEAGNLGGWRKYAIVQKILLSLGKRKKRRHEKRAILVPGKAEREKEKTPSN